MWTAIKFLILAAIVVAAGWWVMHLPGSFSATIGETTLSAPTPVALIAAVVLFIIIYLVLRLLIGLFRLPGRSARMKRDRNRTGGEAALTRTLIALAGGNPVEAQREAARSRRLLGDTPQTLLFAAYAGRQANKPEEEAAAFRLLAARPDAAFLGYRGLLQQAVAKGDMATAADLARQAEASNPGAAWLRTERANLAIAASNWREAYELSPDAPTRASLATAAADAESDPSEARRLAKQAWDADPAFAPAALSYARRLREAGKESRALEVLRSTWGRVPHPDLADAALVDDGDAASRIRRAEWLVKSAPGQPESQLLLARVYRDGSQITAALKSVTAAHQAGMNERRVWMLAADIARLAGKPDVEAEALQRAAVAEPDTAWRCGACGTAHAAWAPVCGVCSTPGRITWGRLDPASLRPRAIAAGGGDPILP